MKGKYLSFLSFPEDPRAYFGAGYPYFIFVSILALACVLACLFNVKYHRKKETLLGATGDLHCTHGATRTHIDGLMLEGDTDSGLVEITHHQADSLSATLPPVEEVAPPLETLTVDCHSYQTGGTLHHYTNQGFIDDSVIQSGSNLGALMSAHVWSTDESYSRECSPVEENSLVRWETLPVCRHKGCWETVCIHHVDIHHDEGHNDSTDSASGGHGSRVPSLGYGTFGQATSGPTPATLTVTCQESAGL